METYLGMKWEDARPLLEQQGIAYRTQTAEPDRPRREAPKGVLTARVVRVSARENVLEIVLTQVPDPLQD